MPFVVSFVPPSSTPSFYNYLNSRNFPYGEGEHLEDFAPFFREHVRLLEPQFQLLQVGGDDQPVEPKPPTGFGDEGQREPELNSIQMKAEVDDDVQYCEPPPVLPNFLKIHRSFEEIKPLDRGPIGFDCSETINLEPGFEEAVSRQGGDGEDIDVGGNESFFDDYTFDGREYMPVKPEPLDDYNAPDLPVLNNDDVENMLDYAFVKHNGDVSQPVEVGQKPHPVTKREPTVMHDNAAIGSALDLTPQPVLVNNEDDEMTDILGMLPVEAPPVDDDSDSDSELSDPRHKSLLDLLAKDAVDDLSDVQDDEDDKAMVAALELERNPRVVRFLNAGDKESKESGRVLKRSAEKRERRKSRRFLEARGLSEEQMDMTPVRAAKRARYEEKTPRGRPPKCASAPHGLPPFACGRCQHAFRDNWHLDRHKNKLNPCTPQGTPIHKNASWRSLQKPKSSGDKVKLLPAVTKKLPRGRPKSVPAKRFNGIHAYACMGCDASFAYYFQLKRHQETHQ